MRYVNYDDKKGIPWGWIITIVIVGLLVFFLFRGCGKGNEHKEDKIQKDSIVDAALESERIANVKLTIYKAANDSLQKQREILKQRVTVLEQQLDQSQGKASRLAYEVKVSKLIHDTVNYIANCDSLAEQVKEFTAYVDGYQENMRQTVNNYEATVAYKDSIISIQAVQYADLRRSFVAVSDKYDVLYKDYSKVVKQKKRERLLTRVLAGALLVAAGKIVLTK